MIPAVVNELVCLVRSVTVEEKHSMLSHLFTGREPIKMLEPLEGDEMVRAT